MRRAGRLLLVAAAIGAVVAAVLASGLDELATDEERLRASVADAGAWGPVLFVALMVVLVPLNVPGLLFVLPSAAMFGPVAGFGLSLLGGSLASAVGIVGARLLGRAAFEGRLPARVLRLEQRIVRRGFGGVAGIRCFTFLLQPVDWILGASSLPMRTALGGTVVGLIPPTLVLCLFGDALLGQL